MTIDPKDMTPTKLQLPEVGRFVLAYGENVGNYIGGKWDVMLYDGGWWEDCGTEVANKAPELWCYLKT